MSSDTEKPSSSTQPIPELLASDILDTVREPMLVLDKNLCVKQANAAFFSHFQIERDETIGQRIYDLGNGRWNFPRLSELLEKVLRGQQLCHDFHVQPIFERIGQRTLLINARRIDHLQLILLAMEDATPREQAEERVGSTALFPEENPFPVLRVDSQGQLLYANRASSELLTQWRCSVGESVPEFVQSELKLALESGTTRELEVQCKDRELSFALVPIRERGYANFYGRDLTKRKRAEAALKESEQRYRDLFYKNHAVMLLIDPGTRQIVDANAAASSFYGYGIEELSSLRITDINTLSNEHLHSEISAAQSAQRRHFFFQHRLANGQIRDVEVFTGPIVLEGRDLLYSIVHDITERKQQDREVERLNADLAKRTTELEDLNRELEAFNFSAAHDLRKPLSIINGYCQVIREMYGDKLDQKCRDLLQEIYDGTLHMNQLIQILLRFSRLAHTRPKRQRVDLSAMAREVLTSLQVAEPQRETRYRIDEKMIVDGDPDLLRVVLDNLMSNAWKYSAAERVTTIKFGTIEIDGEKIYCLRDNGRGFEPSEAKQLFIPFQRLSNVDEINGFGIGLATVQRIIHRHGGRTWAEGKPDKGATFYFTLGPSTEQ